MSYVWLENIFCWLEIYFEVIIVHAQLACSFKNQADPWSCTVDGAPAGTCLMLVTPLRGWVVSSRRVMLRPAAWSCADGSCIVMYCAAGRTHLSAHVAVNLITIRRCGRAGVLIQSCWARWVVKAAQQTVTSRWTAGATYMTRRPWVVFEQNDTPEYTCCEAVVHNTVFVEVELEITNIFQRSSKTVSNRYN